MRPSDPHDTSRSSAHGRTAVRPTRPYRPQRKGPSVAEKRELALRDALRLLAPGPVGLVSTMYRDQPNVMTAAWMLPLSLDPVRIGVAVHPTRLTHEFISKTEWFAINIPNVDLITPVHTCGLRSGRDGDKFAATGLTPTEAREIEAPLIAECVAHIECGVAERRHPRRPRSLRRQRPRRQRPRRSLRWVLGRHGRRRAAAPPPRRRSLLRVATGLSRRAAGRSRTEYHPDQAESQPR